MHHSNQAQNEKNEQGPKCLFKIKQANFSCHLSIGKKPICEKFLFIDKTLSSIIYTILDNHFSYFLCIWLCHLWNLHTKSFKRKLFYMCSQKTKKKSNVSMYLWKITDLRLLKWDTTSAQIKKITVYRLMLIGFPSSSQFLYKARLLCTKSWSWSTFEFWTSLAGFIILYTT